MECQRAITSDKPLKTRARALLRNVRDETDEEEESEKEEITRCRDVFKRTRLEKDSAAGAFTESKEDPSCLRRTAGQSMRENQEADCWVTFCFVLVLS